ncbi:putative phosphoglycerate mutase [Wilcoxina mikolae CBS 423.85]|nr:putative phosphoglycerate mutase [Wilcoxina mikolae CBS 423.85]
MTPRVILARHGETAWTLTGAHTSITDLPLTARGRRSITSSALHTVGTNLAIDPSRLAHIIVSPRLRAQETLSLLLPSPPAHTQITTDNRVREWGYGDYEGLTPAQIRALRKEQGLDTQQPFDIWRDGTTGVGGESPEELKERIDKVIEEIREAQGSAMESKETRADVLVVSHGHFLRAFAKRWLGYELGMPLVMVLDPGGVGVLSYAHNNVEEPAFVLGGVFGVEEEEEERGELKN